MWFQSELLFEREGNLCMRLSPVRGAACLKQLRKLEFYYFSTVSVGHLRYQSIKHSLL